MSVAALPRTDPSPGKSANLFDLWVSNLVDTFNSAMQQLDTELSSLDARLTAGGL